MIDWRLGVGEEDVDGMDDRFCFSLGVQGLFLGYFKITVLGILKVFLFPGRSSPSFPSPSRSVNGYKHALIPGEGCPRDNCVCWDGGGDK